MSATRLIFARDDWNPWKVSVNTSQFMVSLHVVALLHNSTDTGRPAFVFLLTDTHEQAQRRTQAERAAYPEGQKGRRACWSSLLEHHLTPCVFLCLKTHGIKRATIRTGTWQISVNVDRKSAYVGCKSCSPCSNLSNNPACGKEWADCFDVHNFASVIKHL